MAETDTIGAPAAARGTLRVIVNDRPLRQTLTGVGHYVAQLLEHLPRAAPCVQADPFFFTYLSRRDWRAGAAGPGPAEDDDRATPGRQGRAGGASLPKGGRHPRDVGGSRKPWWMRRVMQGAYGALFRMRAGQYHVYHEPNHIPMRCDLPTVTTMHDLSVIEHPDWHPADRVRWYEREFEAGVRQTAVFLAASEFTKQRMVTLGNVPPERVRVTYQAARPVFRAPDAARIRRTLVRLGLSEGCFLYVGTLEPRKNVTGLISAYEALPVGVRGRHPLVLAGAWGWKQQALRETLAGRGLGDHVRFTGYLHDPDLACLYAAATALVWPSWYEGFGLPPLEAMACGCPVLVSDVASLPEVVGDAGRLLPPGDAAPWTDAMRELAEDGDLRARMGRASLARADRFSWTRCAAETAAAYLAALAP